MTDKHTPSPQQREAFKEWSRGANVGLNREWVLNLAPYYINICEEVFYAGMRAAAAEAAKGDAQAWDGFDIDDPQDGGGMARDA